MKIKILAIGKLKEKYWVDASKEYLKRLTPYCDIEIVEFKESKLTDNGAAAEEKVKQEEGLSILSYLSRNYSIEYKEDVKSFKQKPSSRTGATSPYIITLEIKGKRFTSEELAEKISAISNGISPGGSNASTGSKRDIIFIIGGSLGLSDDVCNSSDLSLSFSDMTFPHQMMRVILLEQIYRSFKIIRKETYHK